MGIGTPSEAAQAMELGLALLINTAIAGAKNPAAMARESGYSLAYRTVPVKIYASASSPLSGTQLGIKVNLLSEGGVASRLTLPNNLM